MRPKNPILASRWDAALADARAMEFLLFGMRTQCCMKAEKEEAQRKLRVAQDDMLLCVTLDRNRY